jgi:hypothetical protein
MSAKLMALFMSYGLILPMEFIVFFLNLALGSINQLNVTVFPISNLNLSNFKGLQVWFRDRKRWGLRQMSSRELVATEEGLAALNTLQSANLKYLYLPALLYCEFFV